jgi:Kef-type K+ transport system membrane component KefB
MKADVSFTGVLLVMMLAVTIPLLLGLFPRIPIPRAVVEIVAGILLGPAVFSIVDADATLEVLARLGVAFLLFLAGLELDFRFLRGRPLRAGLIGYALSIGLGVLVTVPLGMTDVIIDPVFVAIVLSATSLGIVLPILKDADQADTPLGHTVIVACSIAEFGPIVLISMFFSSSGDSSPLRAAGKLVVLVLAVILIAVVAARAGRWERLNAVLFKLQDTSAQIRVRVAMMLLLSLLVLSEELKFDAILGAFMAGALLAALTDRGRDAEFGHFHEKLEALGHGFFVPVFFVFTGIAFPLDELFSNASTALRIPLFLALLLIVRGAPALLVRAGSTRAETIAAALLQATSLSFIVVATEIGVAIGELRRVNAASLVAAGMLSVLIFPAVSLALLRPEKRPRGTPAPRVE